MMRRFLRLKTKKEKETEHPANDSPSETAQTEKQNSSQTPEVSERPEGLTCPNEKCGKIILEPLKMIDLSAKSEKHFYACPYCMFKLDITSEEQKSLKPVSIKGPVSAKEAKADKKATAQNCPHYLGYLRERPRNAPIPNECLTCPDTIECLLGNV